MPIGTHRYQKMVRRDGLEPPKVNEDQTVYSRPHLPLCQRRTSGRNSVVKNQGGAQLANPLVDSPSLLQSLNFALVWWISGARETLPLR